LRASSSVIAVTFSGESAKAVALPQWRPSWPSLDVVADGPVTQDVDRRQDERHHLVAFVDELVEALAQLLAGQRRLDDVLHGIDVPAVPVAVVDVHELRHDRADDQRIHVDEVVGHAAHEVFVGDVAAAGNHDRAVRNEQLVVHAVVEPGEVRQRRDVLGQQAVAPAAERIEEADFDVGKRREPDEELVAADGIQIVDDEAHAHAADRGVAHVAQQQVAGLVVVDLVVLDVERARGALGELDPGVERVEPGGHQPKPGQALVAWGCRGLREPHERAVAGRRQGLGRRSFAADRRHAAGGQHRRRCDHHGDP
jgi:hypothetical protein